MGIEDLYQFVSNFGVGMFLAVGLIWVAYRIGNVMVEKILVPIAEQHTKFVRSLSEQVRESSDMIRRLAQAVDDLVLVVHEVRNSVEPVEKVRQALQILSEMMREAYDLIVEINSRDVPANELNTLRKRVEEHHRRLRESLGK